MDDVLKIIILYVEALLNWTLVAITFWVCERENLELFR